MPDVDGTATRWLILAGIGNCAGLLLVYTGVRIGKVGVVASIASTEGAIAALIAVAAGELGQRGKSRYSRLRGRPSRRSRSIQRFSIEYDGWWIRSGVPSPRRIAAASAVRSAE